MTRKVGVKAQWWGNRIGSFRQGDLYFSNDTKKIVNAVFMDSKPYYRYMLEGITINSFNDKQLLPVEDAVDSTFNVKSIVNKKIINKKVYHLVQYADRDRLRIDKDNLIKDNLKSFIGDCETS